MDVNIRNELKPDDFIRLVDVLREKMVDLLTLVDGIDFGFVVTEPLVVSVSNSSYSIDVAVHFEDPIGYVAYIYKDIENRGLILSSNDTEWHIKKTIDEKEIEVDILYALQLIEDLINYACSFRGIRIDDVFMVNSKRIERQIHKAIVEKERKLRGEKIMPFGTLHAKSAREAKTVANDLIPIYVGYDKWDLYGTKKVYKYLPRKLVMKLLKCDCDSMVCEDEFDDDEKDVLKDLVVRKYLKKREVFGKTYYFDLNEKTKRHFLSMLRQK